MTTGKHSKTSKKLTVKSPAKVCCINEITSTTYAFFNKVGGLADWEVGELLQEILAQKLETKAAARRIEDYKQMRY